MLFDNGVTTEYGTYLTIDFGNVIPSKSSIDISSECDRELTNKSST